MPLEALFNPDEWQQALSLPVYCAALVITGDLSGLSGLIQESQALYWVLEGTRGQEQANLLARTAAERLLSRDLETERKELLAISELGSEEWLLAEISRTIAVINNRVESDMRTAYYAWSYELAVDVARAAREGGFLGLGGELVSQKEKAVLDRLAFLLQQPPDPSLG